MQNTLSTGQSLFGQAAESCKLDCHWRSSILTVVQPIWSTAWTFCRVFTSEEHRKILQLMDPEGKVSASLQNLLFRYDMEETGHWIQKNPKALRKTSSQETLRHKKWEALAAMWLQWNSRVRVRRGTPFVVPPSTGRRRGRRGPRARMEAVPSFLGPNESDLGEIRGGHVLVPASASPRERP